MSDADRLKWNARYREEAPPRAVSAVVRAVEDLLPRRGRALDVAGGAGRHAVWLAQRGLTVTLADVADEGLERAREAAAGAGVAVETVAVDLEAAPLPAGPWDLILCFHYLHRPLFASFAACSSPCSPRWPTSRATRSPGPRSCSRRGRCAGSSRRWRSCSTTRGGSRKEGTRRGSWRGGSPIAAAWMDITKAGASWPGRDGISRA
jgi:hypothetical protein